MADERKDDPSGLLDLERELTCSICTDILYQPLTLLDCLHTFCGGCLKEWFLWQAAAAARKPPPSSSSSSSRRHTTHVNPYTCPSCRESVRGTKADWRLTALLEGFLKANPDKGKSAAEKAEMAAQYQPGDDVVPPVAVPAADSDDSADERLLADVRELSMADVDPETARRRAERAARVQHRQHQQQRRHRPEELGRAQRPSAWAAGRAGAGQEGSGGGEEGEFGPGERHVEHQSSLRSLLSSSELDASSQDMQQEILQSIYSEGLLDGIDVNNLTPEQEEELTERIAEAYRRRQRQRERSRNREQRRNGESRSPNTAASRTGSPRRQQQQQQQQQTPASAGTAAGTTSASTPPAQSRPRPPISRPHLFEQSTDSSSRGHRRSASATSQQRNQSATRSSGPNGTPPAARSATDLSNNPGTDEAQRERQRVASANSRSTTDPDTTRDVARRARNDSASLRPQSGSPRARSYDSHAQATTNGRQNHSADEQRPASQQSPSNNASPWHAVRPAPSASNFAPESVQPATPPAAIPSITCTRCSKANIQHSLHYNCSKCHNGRFNLCLSCYRSGHGCDHWFGFGFRAMDHWRALAPSEGWPPHYEHPHVLFPRCWKQPGGVLQQGAFCESCHQFADVPSTSTATRMPGRYWYCEICLEGAWGFCNACTLQGRHCTHPLLPLVPTTSQQQHHTKPVILPIPHLPSRSYALLQPLDPVSCDECTRVIPPTDSRFHCYKCSDGDYDICSACYALLTRTGKLAAADAANGWRRCLHGHRMAIVQHQPTPYAAAGYARVTVADPVGGWRLKDDAASQGNPRAQALPPASVGATAAAGNGPRSVASWSWFPAEENRDELVFPRNAEIREAEQVNEDWSVGVYMGRVGVFPSNHVRSV